jgi:O-antigen/teichoic acid export membrane protein
VRRTFAQLARSDLRVSISASAGRGFNVFLSVASSIILARWLGPDGRGQFAVAASITAIGVQCVTLGFPASITYFAAMHRGSLRALLRRAQVIAAAAGLAFALVVWVLRLAVHPQWCSTIDAALLGMACVNVLASSAMLITQGACLAADEAWRFGWSDAIARLLAITTMAVVAGIGGFSPLAALVCTAGATSITAFWLLRTPALRIAGGDAQVPRLGIELHYGLRSAIAGALGAIPVRVLAIAVAARDGDAAGGQFAVALSVAETIVALGGTFAATRMPAMVRARNQPQALRRELLQTLVSVGTGAVACVLGIAIFAHPIFRFAFGERFIPAAGMLVECMPGAACLAIASVCQYALAARGLPILALAAPAVSAATTWALLTFAHSNGVVSIGAAYTLQGVAFLVTSVVSLASNLRRRSLGLKTPSVSPPSDTMTP